MADTRNINMAIEGGGVKCIAACIAAHVLELNNFVVNEYAGTSGGSIIAALRAFGYSYYDIYEIFGKKLKFSKFLDWSIRAWVRLAACKGNYLENGMAKLLNNYDFRDIKTPLHILASNVTKKRGDFFSHENSPDMNIALAIRLSSSIPGLFITKKHNRCRYWDGGFVANLPIEAYENTSLETVGIVLKSSDEYNEMPFWKIILVIPAIIDMYFTIMEKRYIPEAKWKDILVVNTNGIRTAQFNLSCKDISTLVFSGINGAVDFLVKKRGFKLEEIIKPEVDKIIESLSFHAK